MTTHEAYDNEAGEEDDIVLESPPADQQSTLTPASPQEEAILQEWCSQEHVSLPLRDLNISDGTVKPLSPEEEKELRDTSTLVISRKAISAKDAFFQKDHDAFTAGSEMLIVLLMFCTLISQDLSLSRMTDFTTS